MGFDNAASAKSINYSSLLEDIAHEWNCAGYKMPKLVFWNCNALKDDIPMKDQNGITFVSGASPVIFEMVMSGKTAQDLMYDKLNNKRYKEIY